jgi:hypothetical protein
MLQQIQTKRIVGAEVRMWKSASRWRSVKRHPQHMQETRVKRMQKDGTIEKCGDLVENGVSKNVYRKKGIIIF